MRRRNPGPSAGGGAVARHSPTSGLELLSEHKTRKAAEAAAKAVEPPAPPPSNVR